jgi:hypothetical protein
MKKLSVLLSVFLVLGMIMSANAQVHFGVLGGVNLATASVDPMPEEGLEFSNLTCFGFGAVLDYYLSESIALHLEPMYLQKGTKMSMTIEGFGDFSGEMNVSYIEIPVMLKFEFGANNVRPYIMTGPTIGYRLSAEMKMSFEGEEETEDMKDVTKDINYGVAFGGGVSMQMGNNTFFIEGRYSLGLANINDDPDDTDTTIKTKGIQVFAGITFPL